MYDLRAVCTHKEKNPLLSLGVSSVKLRSLFLTTGIIGINKTTKLIVEEVSQPWWPCQKALHGGVVTARLV